VDGRLRVRNRIYETVFDRSWVRANMPGAELRRQLAAYRLGLLRAAGVMTVVVGSLAFAAVQWQRATFERSGGVLVRRLLYDANMNEAQAAWDEGNVVRVEQLLSVQPPPPADEDLRDFGWYYLWDQLHATVRTLGV